MKHMTIDNVDRQRSYVAAQRDRGRGLGVVFADAFLRGMRDLGYKDPSWALAELLDNAFQAGANTCALRCGFAPENKSQAKPDYLAIMDDGNGMIPEMLSYAVRWGGTDREGDRTGFGRYGYGLPSAAVSMARRYTVYSKTEGAGWYAVTVDIDELANVAGDLDRTEALLTAHPADLPRWLTAGEEDLRLSALESGTVIVLEDLDRLRRQRGWITTKTLTTKLLQRFGVVYRHWLPERRIVVNGRAAQAVDPLFLMEHGRFYDLTDVAAERIEARTFEVETERGTLGRVTIRAAVLPPDFQLQDPAEYGQGRPKLNDRFPIMRDNNGLLICRERRQIDCVPPPWTKFQNYDVNIKIEIDFDAELDEYFGITTSKQQIVLDEQMWERLRQSGKTGGALADLVKDMRRRFEALKNDLKAIARNRGGEGQGARPSVAAILETEPLKGSVVEPSPEQQAEAERNLDRQAGREARATGRPKDAVLADLREQTQRSRWAVHFQDMPEGPFFRPLRLGEQRQLIINTDHPFYAKVYEVAPEVASAVEVLLFVLAERELDSREDAEAFYRAERARWSERLRHALDTLAPDQAMQDKASAVAEALLAEQLAPVANQE